LILALDIGGKRTGVAITDELEIIASGLTTINSKEIVDFVKQIRTEHVINTVVLGKPMHLDNTETHGTSIALSAAALLEKNFPDLEVAFVDERFTSKMATQVLLQSGATKKKRRQKELIDEISATLILQTYLETRRK